MKKIIALLSAAALISAASVTVLAAEITESTDPKQADVTISTSVAPAYTVSIPVNANVAFNAAETDFGSVSLESARLAPNKAVEVTITSDFDLNNSANNTGSHSLHPESNKRYCRGNCDSRLLSQITEYR